MKRDVFTVRISPDEVPAIRAILDQLTAEFNEIEDPKFLADAVVWAQELPRPLRSQLYEFGLREPVGVCLVTGYPVDDDALGRTPEHWRDGGDNAGVLAHEMFFYLCAALLGEPFAWATEQQGRTMHNVVPSRGHENAQLGSSSETALTWHTEDGFHPYRADYVSLMCLRNPDAVQTTYASVRQLDLPTSAVEVLRQPRFVIRPDEAHLSPASLGEAAHLGAPSELLDRAFRQVHRMHADPEPVSALFGSETSPYLRVNSYYMAAVDGDDAAQDALNILIDQLDARMGGIALRPGEMCFLDNYLVVHGRQAFRARFDGADRWLKRLNICRDLRKSRELRIDAASRLIF